MEIVFFSIEIGNESVKGIKLIDKKYYCNYVALVEFILPLRYQLSTELWEIKTLMSS